jgi:hypothetical protein
MSAVAERQNARRAHIAAFPCLMRGVHFSAVHLFFVVKNNGKNKPGGASRALQPPEFSALLSARLKRERPPMSSGGRRSH